MKYILVVINIILIVFFIAAAADILYHVLLALDLDIRFLKGWNQSLLKLVDKLFGVVPNSWFYENKLGVKFVGNDYRLVKENNWWKADLASLLIVGASYTNLISKHIIKII